MSDDDNKKPTDKEKLFTLRANLSVNTEEGNVGAGLLAVHMDRGLLKLREIEEKKQKADKSFNGMLASVEAQMAALDKQIDYWDGVANDAQKEIDRLKAEQANMEEGSDEYNAKQKEIDEQVRIREEALDNKHILQQEKDALEKIHKQALGISSALDNIGAKKKGLDTTAASLVDKLNSVEKKMNGSGMDDVAVLSLINGTYEPTSPEQEALIDEYENIKDEIEVLDVQIDALDKKQDVVTENIIEARKTIEGREATRKVGAIVDTIDSTKQLLTSIGKSNEVVAQLDDVDMMGGWGSEASEELVEDVNPKYDVVADGNIAASKIDLTKIYADAASGTGNVMQEPEVLIKQDGNQYDNFAIS